MYNDAIRKQEELMAQKSKTLKAISAQDKPLMLEQLNRKNVSGLARYNAFFIGAPGWAPLLKFECIMGLARRRQGALGYVLRKMLYPKLMGNTGSNINWGLDLSLRHGRKITLGSGCAIDDGVLLCARGAEENGLSIGNEILIGRNSILQVKLGELRVGNYGVIGTSSVIVACGKISIGDFFMCGPQCYIGGSRHGVNLNDIPMIKQDTYTQGPVHIGNDVWLGAKVTVLDGVSIGDGAVIGAGAVVTKDIPAFSIAVGVPATVIGKRVYEREKDIADIT